MVASIPGTSRHFLLSPNGPRAAFLFESFPSVRLWCFACEAFTSHWGPLLPTPNPSPKCEGPADDLDLRKFSSLIGPKRDRLRYAPLRTRRKMEGSALGPCIRVAVICPRARGRCPLWACRVVEACRESMPNCTRHPVFAPSRLVLARYRPPNFHHRIAQLHTRRQLRGTYLLYPAA